MLQLNKENYIVNLLVNADSNENIEHGLQRIFLLVNADCNKEKKYKVNLLVNADCNNAPIK